ncbi:hypothetical protein [Catellatospora bangladeshensis]|uniref:Uncharacterized protein n=1 Tax=Catellatospora bangladeshensis TaxID=310355 RepID=A0A8J3J8X4_9ACTN|nr:hypothetical protein [Catellatospora bangladeshensis]GIF79611.1 hypothetical protein Cba03nite_09600 [Catellatospora bangladeshensis]
MIDELRATLDQHAELVTARPDPHARVLLRRRRRQRRRGSAIALVAVLLMVGPAVWLAQPDTYPSLAPPPLAAVRPLLDSPTRGSLATDAAFLAAVRRRAAAEVGGQRGGPGGPLMPTEADQIKVLFAGDVGVRRFALVAGTQGWPLKAQFEGPRGTPAAELEQTGSGSLDLPVVEAGYGGGDDTFVHQIAVLVGPAGAVYEEQASERYSSSGVERTWTALATPDDYFADEQIDSVRRIRVRMGGTVLTEVRVAPLAEDTQPLPIDPAPYGGRGTPVPERAAQLAGYLAQQTNQTDRDPVIRVLWSDQLDMPGAPGGRAHVVTVQLVTADGGGPYRTMEFGAAGMGREHPSGSGYAGDPEHTVLVMRLAGFAPEPDDRLQLIAPPGAVRAELVRAGVTTEQALVKGVGTAHVPLDSEVLVRVYDAAGALLGTAAYTDRVGNCDPIEYSACRPLFPAPTPPTR